MNNLIAAKKESPIYSYSQKVAEQGKVDILFVIDNSKSMEMEQRVLARQFDSFLARFQKLDYHIAIITTDAHKDQGRFLKFRWIQAWHRADRSHKPGILSYKCPKIQANCSNRERWIK